MAFAGGCRPWLVPLSAATASPFDPSGQGRDPDATPNQEPPPHPPGTPQTTVDADGLADRLRPFPVPAGKISALRAVEGGFVWLRAQPAGELGDDRAALSDPAARPVLQRLDLRTRDVVDLSADVDAVAVSGDGTRLVVRDGDDVLVLPAGKPAPKGGDAGATGGSGTGSPDRVTVDLDRVGVELDPAAEWRQEYDEAGRRMRDAFWRADMGGVDWAGQLARYRPLVDAIATPDDLVDLLWQVQGELGTSHAYVRPKTDPDKARAQGFLGADLTRDDDGTWRVARVLSGESSDPRARSPLAAPGVRVGDGDALLAVGGRPVDPVTGPGPLLVGTADKPVALTIGPAGGEPPRTVTVVPLSEEFPLRYHEWVAGRRAATHELSGGRLGYVHVPDMMAPGWAQLHRDLRVESAFEGLVVDVRENRGGHTSQLVVEKIARRVISWTVARGWTPSRYPADAPRGPVVLVANEWSGSDGDIVNAAAQELGIGPVVGERTWGGVIGIDSMYRLVDGTTINQPRYATWFPRAGFGVENHGVDPDVEVVLLPQDRSAGRDPQLARAVELALVALTDQPAAGPPDIPPV